MTTARITGTAVSDGQAWGLLWGPTWDPRAQQHRLNRALESVRCAIQNAAAAPTPGVERPGQDLLYAHLALTRDPQLMDPIHRAAETGGTPEMAIARLLEELSEQQLPGRARLAEDIRAVLQRLLHALADESQRPGPPDGPVILVGDPPSIESALWLHGEGRLAGIIAPRGGQNSHIALLARQLGVPAVLGLGGALAATTLRHSTLAMDGSAGWVEPSPARPVALRARHALASAPVPGFVVRADLFTTEQVSESVQWHAEGVGLLRTDTVFNASEDSLSHAFSNAAALLSPHPLTIRFFDRPPDTSRRGAAILESHPQQCGRLLRAACRAAEHGHVRVLIPAVRHPDEVAKLKQALHDSAAALQLTPPPLGVMLETTEAVRCATAILGQAAFAVVGTGDLTAELAGVHREELAHHDRGLREQILVDIFAELSGAAKMLGRPLEGAGPLARRTRWVGRMRALGFTGVSVAPADIAAIRAAVMPQKA